MHIASRRSHEGDRPGVIDPRGAVALADVMEPPPPNLLGLLNGSRFGAAVAPADRALQGGGVPVRQPVPSTGMPGAVVVECGGVVECCIAGVGTLTNSVRRPR